MINDILDCIADDLLTILPLFYKNFLKIENRDIDISISFQHLQILYKLNKYGALPMSEIGKKMSISKSNMTFLVDKLIGEKMVERLSDEKDRRIIYIALTDKGRKSMGEYMALVKNNIKSKLSSLQDEDVEQLSVSLQNIKKIVSKINLVV